MARKPTYSIYKLLVSREVNPAGAGEINFRGSLTLTRLLTDSGSGRKCNFRAALENWVEDDSLRHCSTVTILLRPPPSSTIAVAYSPSGRLVATSHGDHSIRISCATRGTCLKTLMGHTRTPWALRFHPRIPHLLTSGSLDGRVCLWDLRTDKCVASHQFGHPVSSLAFDAEGRTLALVSGHELWAWDMLDPEHAGSTNCHAQPTGMGEPHLVVKSERKLRAVLFHPRGRGVVATAEVVSRSEFARDVANGLLPPGTTSTQEDSRPRAPAGSDRPSRAAAWKAPAHGGGASCVNMRVTPVAGGASGHAGCPPCCPACTTSVSDAGGCEGTLASSHPLNIHTATPPRMPADDLHPPNTKHANKTPSTLTETSEWTTPVAGVASSEATRPGHTRAHRPSEDEQEVGSLGRSSFPTLPHLGNWAVPLASATHPSLPGYSFLPAYSGTGHKGGHERSHGPNGGVENDGGGQAKAHANAGSTGTTCDGLIGLPSRFGWLSSAPSGNHTPEKHAHGHRQGLIGTPQHVASPCKGRDTLSHHPLPAGPLVRSSMGKAGSPGHFRTAVSIKLAAASRDTAGSPLRICDPSRRPSDGPRKFFRGDVCASERGGELGRCASGVDASSSGQGEERAASMDGHACMDGSRDADEEVADVRGSRQGAEPRLTSMDECRVAVEEEARTRGNATFISAGSTPMDAGSPPRHPPVAAGANFTRGAADGACSVGASGTAGGISSSVQRGTVSCPFLAGHTLMARDHLAAHEAGGTPLNLEDCAGWAGKQGMHGFAIGVPGGRDAGDSGGEGGLGAVDGIIATHGHAMRGGDDDAGSVCLHTAGSGDAPSRVDPEVCEAVATERGGRQQHVMVDDMDVAEVADPPAGRGLAPHVGDNVAGSGSMTSSVATGANLAMPGGVTVVRNEAGEGRHGDVRDRDSIPVASDHGGGNHESGGGGRSSGNVDHSGLTSAAASGDDAAPSQAETRIPEGGSVPAQERLPSTARLCVWQYDDEHPSFSMGDARRRLVIRHAVLSTDMGAHFSPCGLYLAACVACQRPASPCSKEANKDSSSSSRSGSSGSCCSDSSGGAALGAAAGDPLGETRPTRDAATCSYPTANAKSLRGNPQGYQGGTRATDASSGHQGGEVPPTPDERRGAADGPVDGDGVPGGNALACDESLSSQPLQVQPGSKGGERGVVYELRVYSVAEER
eukprot:jgi/Mesvir1/26874/Mv20613-RA.3